MTSENFFLPNNRVLLGEMRIGTNRFYHSLCTVSDIQDFQDGSLKGRRLQVGGTAIYEEKIRCTENMGP